MKIIISGGGTGGHIFPAVAVADELRKEMPDCQILFVGAEGRMEMERVPKAGYPIAGVPIQGFQRKLSFLNILKNLQLLYKLPLSIWRVLRIISKFKPDIVAGFGGFASGPILRAAQSKGIPTVLQEQNGFAGVTNKLSAEQASAICVAYEGMERFFPSEKIVLTGNPVRHEVWQLKDRELAAKHFGLDPNKQTIFIVGGSLGAKTLNLAMEHNTQLIENQKDIQILWQCGKLYENDFKSKKVANLSNVKMLTFIDRMDLAYSVADLVISRAGALSISELCLVGRPSILIPSPNVAEDHQTKNAMALVEKKAAILISDSEANTMIAKSLEVLENKNLSKSLMQNILKLGKPTAAIDIANVIREVVEKEKK